MFTQSSKSSRNPAPGGETHTGETHTEGGLVACQVCLTEIPTSVAVNQEADEYTLHFCGIDCYNQWKSAQEADD